MKKMLTLASLAAAKCFGSCVSLTVNITFINPDAVFVPTLSLDIYRVTFVELLYPIIRR